MRLRPRRAKTSEPERPLEAGAPPGTDPLAAARRLRVRTRRQVTDLFAGHGERRRLQVGHHIAGGESRDWLSPFGAAIEASHMLMAVHDRHPLNLVPHPPE